MNRIVFIFILSSFQAIAQQELPLYEGTIPNSIPTTEVEKTESPYGTPILSNITKPTLQVFLAPREKRNGTAVLICPGGGYASNAIAHEGTDVAKKLNEWGVSAFVLKYRTPSKKTMENPEIGPLQDVQRAMQLIKNNAADWRLNTNRIGVMGFSAGGHLASTLATHLDQPVIANPQKINLRPDFLILAYPVISFQEGVMHAGSRERLLGKTPEKNKIDYYSNELKVTQDTPPTFLVHASDDEGVKPENSILFYQALLRNKVPAELHLYQRGGHGFGMHNRFSPEPWMDRLKAWMQANGWL